jgi:hypothetical protein
MACTWVQQISGAVIVLLTLLDVCTGSLLSAVPLFSCFWFSYGSADWLYFFSTLYAGRSSVSIIGSSDFARTIPGRLLYLFDSMAAISVTSLTLTYLMQIYNQLQLRNTLP